MQIQITQTYPKIGVDVEHGKVNMQTQKAQLDLHHENTRVEIHNDFPRVIIDNRECFNTSGLEDLETFSSEYVQLGRQAALQYIGKIAEDGNALAAIENRGNPIPDIAERDAYTTHEFNIDFMPKARPKISVTGGVQTIAVNPPEGANNGVQGTYTPGHVNYDVIPTKVSFYMRQQGTVNIDFVGSNVDIYK